MAFRQTKRKKITDVLLLSDVYGIESHGMQRLVRYHKGIEKGLIHVDAKPEIIFETPVSAVIDGHDGMGQLISIEAMNIAIEKAKKSGMAVVSVKNSNHFGIAGYYAKMACDQGLIGFAMTNSEAIMVPTYARKAMLGSNPIAISMPAESYPFFFDASTTVVTRGKLEIYNKLSKPLPEGWALDENGKPCSDADRVLKNIVGKNGGGIVPLGGDTEALKERFSVFLQELSDAPKAEGAPRIYTHGEKEIIASADRMQNGIDVNINTVAEMKDLCDYLGLDSKEYLGDVNLGPARQSSYK